MRLYTWLLSVVWREEELSCILHRFRTSQGFYTLMAIYYLSAGKTHFNHFRHWENNFRLFWRIPSRKWQHVCRWIWTRRLRRLHFRGRRRRRKRGGRKRPKLWNWLQRDRAKGGGETREGVIPDYVTTTPAPPRLSGPIPSFEVPFSSLSLRCRSISIPSLLQNVVGTRWEKVGKGYSCLDDLDTKWLCSKQFFLILP